MPKTIGSITAMVAAQLALVALATPAGAAGAADECLAGPNGAAPKGSHWYYRVDKTTKRHCWYVGPEGKAVSRAERPASAPPVADTKSEATALPPTSATPRIEAAAVPPVPAMPRQMVQDGREGVPSQSSGFGQRWSELPATPQMPAVPSQSGGADAQESASQVAPVVQAAAPSSPGIEVVPPAPEAAADEAPGGVSVLMLVLIAIGLGGVGLLVRAGLRLWVARRPKVYVDRHRADWSTDWPAERISEPVEPTDDASFAPPLVPRDAPVRPTDVARFPVEPIALREAEQDLVRLLRKVRQRAA